MALLSSMHQMTRNIGLRGIRWTKSLFMPNVTQTGSDRQILITMTEMNNRTGKMDLIVSHGHNEFTAMNLR